MIVGFGTVRAQTREIKYLILAADYVCKITPLARLA